MDLIVSLANMRARNYGIQEVEKLKAKFIAGRIIPAIATSTALTTGLVCLELYKVLAGGHPIEDYRNTFGNLSLPFLVLSEPFRAPVMKHGNMEWTVWNRWYIKGNITVAELLNWLSDKGLSAYSISCGNALLYNTMFPRHKDRLSRKIVDVTKEVAKVDIPEYRKHVDVVVACEDDKGNDIDIPLISIYFR
jgi:ubiquitin-activating enzyme E1